MRSAIDFCFFLEKNSHNCWICNGYYGPSYEEPLCGTCHSFVFPNADEIPEGLVTKFSDDEDSGNEEPEEIQEKLEEGEINFYERPRPQPPRNLEHYVDMLTRPNPADNPAAKNDPKIKQLPVEVLLKIFAYLDDLSLWNISLVCKQWKKILEIHTSQTMWKRYTKERFPLYQQISTIPNWFHVGLFTWFIYWVSSLNPI